MTSKLVLVNGLTLEHAMQFLSIRVFSVTHDQTAAESARLLSISYGTTKNPSGKTFLLQTDGAHVFTARTRGACELCPLDPSIDLGVLSGFAGTPLRVMHADTNPLGQLLRVSRADKTFCDIVEANNQLVCHVLQVTFK
jgi:hypothetical protein